jgi:hypothetical protein
MTRARALKQIIRDRAAKTGERYTTARRHILRGLNPTATAKAVAPQTKVSTKGGISDAKSIEKTGHDLAHWFAILDRFGAIDKGHTAATTMLQEKYTVPGWYVQGIVVAYERARGKRVMNQTCYGDFHVSVSKTVAATPSRVAILFSDAKQRKQWADRVDADLGKALAAGVKLKGITTRADGQARVRYKWDGMTVQFYMYPKPGDKTSVVVDHMDLSSQDAVESFRGRWKAALEALVEALK